MRFRTVYFSALFLVGLLQVFAFPDLFLRNKINFANSACHDYAQPYGNIFTLTQDFSNGRLSLWNGCNMFAEYFNHASWGLFTLTNSVAAASLALLLPWVENQASLFHAAYPWLYFGVNNALRILGMAFLLRKLGFGPGPSILVLVLFGTTLSAPFTLGLLTNNLFSYLPWLVYFVVSFLQKPAKEPALGFMFAGTLAVWNSPLFALGYFYEALHFFLLAALIAWWIWPRRQKLEFRKAPFPWLAAGFALVMLVGVVQICLRAQGDFFLEGTGLGGTKGRFEGWWNPWQYWQNESAGARPEDLIRYGLNPSLNQWWVSWQFFGFAALFLALAGFFYAPWSIRILFGAPILLLILANGEKSFTSPSMVSHLLIAFTNPLKFLLRSHHMASFALPVFLAPLCAFGVKGLWNNVWAARQHEDTKEKMVRSLVLCLVLAVLFSFPVQTTFYTWSLILMTLLWFLPCARMKLNYRSMVAFALLLLVVWIENHALKEYGKAESYSRQKVEPRQLHDQGEEKEFIDYQNPLIEPFPYFLRAAKRYGSPGPNQENGHINCYGRYFHSQYLGAYFEAPMIYVPRHKSFARLHLATGEYARLQGDPRNVVWGRAQAVAEADRGVELTVEAPGSGWQKDFIFPVAEGRRERVKSGVRYRWALPPDFPAEMASSVMPGMERCITGWLGEEPLQPAQGRLVRPGSLDVRNINRDRVYVLAKREAAAGTQLRVRVEKPDPVLIWQELRQDRLDFKVRNGNRDERWLMIHYPYDEAWRAKVDGQEQPIFRANGFFMAVRVPPGERAICMEYAPGSLLRWGIAAGLVGNVWLFTCISVFALRDLDG